MSTSTFKSTAKAAAKVTWDVLYVLALADVAICAVIPGTPWWVRLIDLAILVWTTWIFSAKRQKAKDNAALKAASDRLVERLREITEPYQPKNTDDVTTDVTKEN